jgi:hypothetical protein
MLLHGYAGSINIRPLMKGGSHAYETKSKRIEGSVHFIHRAIAPGNPAERLRQQYTAGRLV